MNGTKLYHDQYSEFWEKRDKATGYDFGQAPIGNVPPPTLKALKPLRWWSWDRPGRLRALMRWRDQWQEDILKLGKPSSVTGNDRGKPAQESCGEGHVQMAAPATTGSVVCHLNPVSERREAPLLLKRLVVRLAILMVIAFILFGCTTTEQGKRIIPDEVRWIEKERTTRAEVVARFGSPPVEFPQSGFTTISTTTTTDSEGHTKTVQITSQNQRPTRLRKATYVYTRREAAVFPFYDNLQSTQCQFWVVYDEKGLVQDYGFLGDACEGQLQDKGLHLAAH